MKVCHLAIPVLVCSQEDESTLLSMKMKVQSTLEAGLDQLLDVVGSRNVTEMSALLQNLVEETISEGVNGPYDLPAETYTALDVIKGALLGDIRTALKDAHRNDQKELHERILCFENCEIAKTSGAASCGASCDGSAHKGCRDDLLIKYKSHVQACWTLDKFVNEFNYNHCPEYTKKTCLLSDSTWNCLKCQSEMNALYVEGKEGAPEGTEESEMSTSAWFTYTIQKFEEAHESWETHWTACTNSYTEYIKHDAKCDCMQAECETKNCEWENCHYENCEDVYNKCWGRCEAEYERTNEAKECLEKDRKIDWSATEKIECYVNVLLQEPDNATLLSVCGSTNCYNEYREKMYKTCNTICEEVDYDNPEAGLVHGVALHNVSHEHKHHHRHHRRDHRDASYSGRNSTQGDSVTDHKHRHRDIDVTYEGKDWVRTKHRNADESVEKRCTSHLDLDYQVPPCCTPCLVRPAPPCTGKDNDYSGGCTIMEDKSYMCTHYGMYNFMASSSVEGLTKPLLTGVNAPQVVDDCHKKAGGNDHAKYYAYNLCTCLDCILHPRADPPTCTSEKYCKNYKFQEFLNADGGYNYRRHDTTSSVTCKLSSDNDIDEVYIDGIDVTSTVTNFENLGNWPQLKTITFEGSRHTRMAVKASDGNGPENGKPHGCEGGGFAMRCEAADTSSPWHGLETDQNWKAKAFACATTECLPLSTVPGRCGPLFGGGRCDNNLVSWDAFYCNKANGWCGWTGAHKHAQGDDIYDYAPAACRCGYGGSGADKNTYVPEPEATWFAYDFDDSSWSTAAWGNSGIAGRAGLAGTTDGKSICQRGGPGWLFRSPDFLR